MSKKKQEYVPGKITIQTEDRWNEIKEFNLYHEEKKAIQDKYPTKPWQVQVSPGPGNHKDPFEKEWWDEWQEYKKEITDLILKPNGNFTKFLYQITSEKEDVVIRTWLRGSYNTEKYMKARNRNERD